MYFDKGIIFFLFSFLFYLCKNPRRKLLLIKSPHSFNKYRFSWGEYHLSKDLAEGFEFDNRFKAFVVPFEYWDLNVLNKLAFASIVFRGVRKCQPHPSNPHFIYLICHPNEVEIEELKKYKNAFVASEHYTNELNKLALKAVYIPQFTNSEKFKFNAESKPSKAGVLFVGNTRGVFRKSMKYCYEKGIKVDIFGRGWEIFVHADQIKAEGVNNSTLPLLYRSYPIVLNDHWEDMLKNGFISNRIFDVTATGGFVLTEESEHIKRMFGDAVVTYSSADDLAEKIKYYLHNPKERIAKTEQARMITLKRYTHKAVAMQMIDLIGSALPLE